MTIEVKRKDQDSPNSVEALMLVRLKCKEVNSKPCDANQGYLVGFDFYTDPEISGFYSFERVEKVVSEEPGKLTMEGSPLVEQHKAIKLVEPGKKLTLTINVDGSDFTLEANGEIVKVVKDMNIDPPDGQLGIGVRLPAVQTAIVEFYRVIVKRPPGF